MAGRHKNSWQRTLFYYLIGDEGIGFVVPMLVAIIAVGGVYLADQYQWTMGNVWSLGTVSAYAVFLFTSPKIRRSFHFEEFCGYWMYTNRPSSVNPKNPEANLPGPRYVWIDFDEPSLRMRVFHEGKLYANVSETATTGFGRKSGKIFYWYESLPGVPKDDVFKGIVTLTWHKDDLATRIASMTGAFYPDGDGDSGAVEYQRIDKEEYEAQTLAPSSNVTLQRVQ